jgi:hypothetical protein
MQECMGTLESSKTYDLRTMEPTKDIKFRGEYTTIVRKMKNNYCYGSIFSLILGMTSNK